MGKIVENVLKSSNSYKDLVFSIKSGVSPVAVSGVIPESLAHLIYTIKEDLSKHIFVITKDEYRAKRLSEELKTLMSETVEIYPKKDILLYDIEAYSQEVSLDRLNLMNRLSNGNKEKIVAISSIESVFGKISSKERFLKSRISIEVGKSYDVEEIMNSLVAAGYERVDMVEGKGQFSSRGGILDIFSTTEEQPYRIEFFDDEADSIRSFDVASQRSIENLKEVTVNAARELILYEEERLAIADNLESELKTFAENFESEEDYSLIHERLSCKFKSYVDRLRQNMDIRNAELTIPYIGKGLSSILDYLDEDSLVIIDEPSRVEENLAIFMEKFEEDVKSHAEIGEVFLSHMGIYFKKEKVLDKIKSKNVILTSNLMRTGRLLRVKGKSSFLTKGVTNYQGDIGLFSEDIRFYQKNKNKVVIFSEDQEKGKALQQDMRNLDLNARYVDDGEREVSPGEVIIVPRAIEKGFEYTDIGFVFLSYRDIFGTKKKKRRSKFKNASKIQSFTDLKLHDYVVHENHGIGKYLGIDQLEVQGIKKDYMVIEYSGEDKLYIPIDQMNLIQKYIGSESPRLKLNKLGSSDWNKTKSKVKKAIEDMAHDLIELYAKREVVKGYSYFPDTPWQLEFEDMFPYTETDDQLRASEEIKRDMEKSKPMDRLLCGDVGYGKTEVAMRAVFKAVMDGKQVAFLVPTTILADQHHKTMIDRFSGFPVKVESLSRLKTSKQQKKILDDLRTGKIDVLIGTHKIISKDVVFKDLGFLVIDEEQRFGVKQKEAIKTLKKSIDVLTLTATPIPRTLHMSLSGIRDMSVLEEPPKERYPIQTYVTEYNENIARDAILKEISRDGQVYFLYNKVRTIEVFAATIQKLVPEARICIAHGQMGERNLEAIMLDFLNREYDVLICTTIIETGLDIPNVNTIIIADADKMGLSQLYQLRGRVGRSNRIAFAYFMYEKNRVLSEVSEKRLKTIKEFTELGSGFKIAMRDLEIRGAGNLLGAEQHGQMAAIGYDLYVKYLEAAIRRLKGDLDEENIETTIEINVDGYIKDSYIPSREQKIEVYKKISGVETREDAENMIDELIDMYGDVSREVVNLIWISHIRHVANKLNIESIGQTGGMVRIVYGDNRHMQTEVMQGLMDNCLDKIEFSMTDKPAIIYKLESTEQIQVIDEIKKILYKMCSFLA